jgi:hypothetical protein
MEEETTIEQAHPMLQLGDKAPDFKAVTTHEPISLSDYNGQWVMHALACNEILSCPEFLLPHPLQALFLP